MVSKKSQNKAMSRNEILKDRLDKDMEAPEEDEVGDAFEDPKPQIPEPDPDENEVVEAAKEGAGHYATEIYGHKVTFDILNIRKQVQALQLASTVKDETGHIIALKAAYFAMSVDTIDDAPFYVNVANDGSERIQRYNIALNYHTSFVNRFFDEYVQRESEIEEKLNNLKK